MPTHPNATTDARLGTAIADALKGQLPAEECRQITTIPERHVNRTLADDWTAVAQLYNPDLNLVRFAPVEVVGECDRHVVGEDQPFGEGFGPRQGGRGGQHGRERRRCEKLRRDRVSLDRLQGGVVSFAGDACPRIRGGHAGAMLWLLRKTFCGSKVRLTCRRRAWFSAPQPATIRSSGSSAPRKFR